MDQWNRRLNLYAEYIMQNAGLDEAQVGIKIALGKAHAGSSSSGPSPGTKYEPLCNSAIPWPQCEQHPPGDTVTCTQCDTVETPLDLRPGRKRQHLD